MVEIPRDTHFTKDVVFTNGFGCAGGCTFIQGIVAFNGPVAFGDENVSTPVALEDKPAVMLKVLIDDQIHYMPVYKAKS